MTRMEPVRASTTSTAAVTPATNPAGPSRFRRHGPTMASAVMIGDPREQGDPEASHRRPGPPPGQQARRGTTRSARPRGASPANWMLWSARWPGRRGRVAASIRAATRTGKPGPARAVVRYVPLTRVYLAGLRGDVVEQQRLGRSPSRDLARHDRRAGGDPGAARPTSASSVLVTSMACTAPVPGGSSRRSGGLTVVRRRRAPVRSATASWSVGPPGVGERDHQHGRARGAGRPEHSLDALVDLSHLLRAGRLDDDLDVRRAGSSVASSGRTSSVSVSASGSASVSASAASFSRGQARRGALGREARVAHAAGVDHDELRGRAGRRARPAQLGGLGGPAQVRRRWDSRRRPRSRSPRPGRSR